MGNDEQFSEPWADKSGKAAKSPGFQSKKYEFSTVGNSNYEELPWTTFFFLDYSGSCAEDGLGRTVIESRGKS